MIILHKSINIRKLNRDLHYHPSWYKDKDQLFKLLKQSNFTDEEITEFGRIYVRYNNTKYFKELKKYFNHIIEKMHFDGPQQLFAKTKQIYKIHSKNKSNSSR